MVPQKCALCDCAKGIRHECQVCHKKHCNMCCKRYLALEAAPAELVLCCNECFLKNVIWDTSRIYDVFGPADGKPVVLVHGALIGRQCLVLEARALADAGYRVIVPDLAAHGARFKDVPLTLNNAVSTVCDVIKKEAPGQKVVVMGFSMGGYVAAAFAAAHPELTAAVLMGGCAHDTHTITWKFVGKLAEFVYAICSPKTLPDLPANIPHSILPPTMTAEYDAAAKTKSGFIYKSLPEVMSKQRPEIQECFLRAGAEVDAWKYTWRVMYDADMNSLLPQITCPGLVVVGERDFRSHESVWLSKLRKGRLLVLKGGEHPFMLQPGVVDEYRKEAIAFAEAAEWGKTGEVTAAPPPAGAAAATAAGKDGHDKEGLLAAGNAQLEVPKRVGLGVVFQYLWKQRKEMK